MNKRKWKNAETDIKDLGERRWRIEEIHVWDAWRKRNKCKENKCKNKYRTHITSTKAKSQEEEEGGSYIPVSLIQLFCSRVLKRNAVQVCHIRNGLCCSADSHISCTTLLCSYLCPYLDNRHNDNYNNNTVLSFKQSGWPISNAVL